MNKIHDDWFIDENGKYVCECGRMFNTSGSFRSHRRFCDCHEHAYDYQNVKKHRIQKNFVSIDNYKTCNDNYICECGASFNNKNSISAHFGHCLIHKDLNNIKTERKYNKTFFFNKTDDEIREIRKRSTETLKKKISSGERVYSSRKQTKETKEKLREIFIKKHAGLNYYANYSKKACDFIDNLNKKYGWCLQHALNGGEIIVSGYYLDGYDKENNIAFEYDEYDHYTDVENSILNVKDQERQYIIMKKLNCRLFRYNEKIDYLYEVINPKEPEFEDIKSAIEENKIDYTTRKTIRLSLKKLGLSSRKYDLYVKDHPDCGAISYPDRRKYSDEEREKKRKEREKKSIEHKERKNKKDKIRLEIYKVIKANISNIDLSKWNRCIQIKNILFPYFGDVTTKKIKVSLKNNDINLYKMIFNRENLGSYGQVWIVDENGNKKRVKKE